MNKKLKSLGFVILFFATIFLLNRYSEFRDLQMTVDEINSEFSGVVIQKYSLRKTRPTCLRLQTIKNKTIEICPDDQVVEYAQTGDSIIKLKGENVVYVIDKNGRKTELFYVRISNKDRENKNFPEHWRDKWMDSSVWDKRD